LIRLRSDICSKNLRKQDFKRNWATTSEDRPLCAFIINEITRGAVEIENVDRFPPEMLVELVLVMK
jgi:hypothetical protein